MGKLRNLEIIVQVDGIYSINMQLDIVQKKLNVEQWKVPELRVK